MTELRDVELRRQALLAEIASEATPGRVRDLNQNLPALYRQQAEALRSIVDASLVTQGDRRGDVSLSRRGDSASVLLLDAKNP